MCFSFYLSPERWWTDIRFCANFNNDWFPWEASFRQFQAESLATMSGLVSQIDLNLIISENYITFLLLGGLLVVIYAYSDIHLSATRKY